MRGVPSADFQTHTACAIARIRSSMGIAGAHCRTGYTVGAVHSRTYRAFSPNDLGNCQSLVQATPCLCTSAAARIASMARYRASGNRTLRRG